MEILKTFGHIRNQNGTFDVCLVENAGTLWLATYDPETDEVDTLDMVDSLEDAIQLADKEFKSQDTYVVDTTTEITGDSISEVISMDNQETLFTPAAVLDFLRQIDELADKDINVFDNDSFALITIGDSQYRIDYSNAEDVEVSEEVVEEVTDIVEETYDALGAEGVELEEIQDITEEEVVEGGIIKEALKTLAVGGLVRLTGKMLGKDVADAIIKK